MNQNFLEVRHGFCVQIYTGLTIQHLAVSYSQTGKSTGDKCHKGYQRPFHVVSSLSTVIKHANHTTYM